MHQHSDHKQESAYENKSSIGLSNRRKQSQKTITNKGIRKINNQWHPNNQQAPASDYQTSISIRKASKHQHQTTKTSKHKRNKSRKQASGKPRNYQHKKYKQV
jgi:hypothetical protein